MDLKDRLYGLVGWMVTVIQWKMKSRWIYKDILAEKKLSMMEKFKNENKHTVRRKQQQNGIGMPT